MLFEFRQAEIQNLSLFTCGYENVRRLDVAMHDPFSVRGLECPGGLNGEIEQFIDWKGRATCPLTRSRIAGPPALRSVPPTPSAGSRGVLP